MKNSVKKLEKLPKFCEATVSCFNNKKIILAIILIFQAVFKAKQV